MLWWNRFKPVCANCFACSSSKIPIEAQEFKPSIALISFIISSSIWKSLPSSGVFPLVTIAKRETLFAFASFATF